MGTNDSVLKLRLSKEHLELLDRYCNALGENRSEVIRTLICFAYDRMLFIDETEINNLMFDYYKDSVINKYKAYQIVKEKRAERINEYLVDGLISAEKLNKINDDLIDELQYCDESKQLFYDMFDKESQ